MKEIKIAGTPRESVGKGPARRTRMVGNIPAVVYGPEQKPVSISVEGSQIRRALKETAGGTTLFDLEVAGKTRKVLVRELQRDPVTSQVVHIDFHAISMTKPIHLLVPLHFEGSPIGVKVDGGIMQTTMREIEVSCLPADIPERIEINVDELHIGDSIHVRDIDVPNAKVLSEEQRTVVVISAPTVIKETVTTDEIAEGEEAVAAEGAEAAETAETPKEGEKTEEKKKE